MTHEGGRVLIVDDEQVVCDVLNDELEEKGYLCAKALNGYDALRRLSLEEFDTVLLDIMLPGMSGIELLKEIRLNHRDVVTIMITAIKDVDTAVEVMKLGAIDYIVKPFDLDRVNNAVHIAIETKKYSVEREASDLPSCAVVEEKGKQTLGELDAIALGVEARIDQLTGYSRQVIEKTADIARRMGLSEKEIQRWIDIRAKLSSEKYRKLKSSEYKLRRNALAQVVLGLTKTHSSIPKPKISHN